MDNLICAILAGGRGTRLFPLTFKKAKPAVLFGTGYRLIDIPISNALNSGISNICVFTQYYPDLLEAHIQEAFFSRRIAPAKIEVFQPPIGDFGESQLFQGTADAMRKLKDYFKSQVGDYVLILSGDQLYTMDFNPFLEMARKNEADLLIACLKVKESDAKRMGVMQINSANQIIDFQEKPQKQQDLDRLKDPKGHFLASMGIYIFKKTTLLSLLEEKGDDFGKDLIPKQLEKGGVYAYPFDGYWEDIGTIDSFFKANMALISQSNCLQIADENYPILSKEHYYTCPLIHNCHIEESLLAQGTRIKADKISKSVVGLGTSIGQGSRLDSCVILGSTDRKMTTSIGEYSQLKGVILDEGVQIGNHVKLMNYARHQNYDGPGIFIRDGVTIVQAGTVIPDGFEL